jgi:hypothetical protein
LEEISIATKLQIFMTNVKPVLLYGCEIWKCTKIMFQSLQIFINRCLRRVFKIFWPQTISNEHLWKMAREKPIIIQIKDRKWQWIGHTLRKDSQATERQDLNRNPQGRRKR